MAAAETSLQGIRCNRYVGNRRNADSRNPNQYPRRESMKRLSVVVAGTGQIRDVEIQPGTTAGDMLNQLSLRDYFSPKGRTTPSSPMPSRYTTRSMTARKSSLPPKPRWACSHAVKRPPRPVPASLQDLFLGVRGQPRFPCSAARFPIGRNGAGTSDGNTYTGSYRTRYGAFTGEIRQHHGNDIEFFLYQPSQKSSGTAIGPAFSTNATTGIWCIWAEGPRT